MKNSLYVPKKWRAPHPSKSRVAIPIALYRAQIGPTARNGKKWGKKWILAPREKGGKMAEKWENWPKNGPTMAIFPFSAIFSPFLKPFFSHFGPEARSGVCTGRAIGIANQEKQFSESYCRNKFVSEGKVDDGHLRGWEALNLTALGMLALPLLTLDQAPAKGMAKSSSTPAITQAACARAAACALRPPPPIIGYTQILECRKWGFKRWGFKQI